MTFPSKGRTAQEGLARVDTLLQANRPDLAEQAARAMLADHPESGRGHAALAAALTAQGRHEEALVEADDGVRLAPNDCYPHQQLGDARLAAGRRSEAIAAYREAVSADPRSAHHRAALAHALYFSGAIQEALAVAEDGLALDPHDMGCLNARGLALLGLLRVEEARSVLRGALGNNPGSAELHSNLGLGLVGLGRPREAAEELREALRLDPSLTGAKAGLETAQRLQRHSASSGARFMRANLWWRGVPRRYQLGALASLGLASLLWPGFVATFAAVACFALNAAAQRAALSGSRWRHIGAVLRPHSTAILNVGFFLPSAISVCLLRFDWGLGGGLGLFYALVAVVSEPPGLIRNLALAVVVLISTLGVIAQWMEPAWLPELNAFTIATWLVFVPVKGQIPNDAGAQWGIGHAPGPQPPA